MAVTPQSLGITLSTRSFRRSRPIVWALLVTISVLSCDTARPTVEQIRNDEDLAIFNVGVVKITPIEFNIDTNRLAYEYETMQTNADTFFTLLDSEAVREGWKIEERATRKRGYSRIVRFNEHYDLERVVSVALSSVPQRVEIVATVRQWLPVRRGLPAG
jgi:hypothetical protein